MLIIPVFGRKGRGIRSSRPAGATYISQKIHMYLYAPVYILGSIEIKAKFRIMKHYRKFLNKIIALN